MSEYSNGGGFEKREGNGALFKNNKMTSDRSPVMTGYIVWKGEEIRIAGWSKVTVNGDKMLSLSAEPANQHQGENNGGSSVNNNTNIGQSNNLNQDQGSGQGGSGSGDVNDEIPF